MASTVGALADSSFAFRDGRVRPERGAKRVRSFDTGGRKRDAISVGSSEHFALPRIAPQLREVNVYLGWFGPLSRPMQVMSMGTALPGVSKLLGTLGDRFVKGSTGGPDARGALQVELARRRDRLRRGRPGAGRGAAVRRERLHVHRAHARLGRASGPPRARCRARAPSGRSDAFGLVALTDGCRWAGLEEAAGAPGAARARPAAACGCQVTRPHVAGLPCWSARRPAHSRPVRRSARDTTAPASDARESRTAAGDGSREASCSGRSTG